MSQVAVTCDEPYILNLYSSDCHVECRKQESRVALETVLVTV